MAGSKILGIVESGYRGTLESQEDAVLRLCGELARAGAEFALLFRGNAVNYLNKRQQPPPLKFGDGAPESPPRVLDEVAALGRANVALYYVDEDAGERGMVKPDLAPLARAVSRSNLTRFVAGFDRLLHF